VYGSGKPGVGSVTVLETELRVRVYNDKLIFFLYCLLDKNNVTVETVVCVGLCVCVRSFKFVFVAIVRVCVVFGVDITIRFSGINRIRIQLFD